METERELTETVWRRHEFLQSLTKGPKTKKQLTDELGYAEQTIYKRLRELKNHNLARKTPKGYRLTLLGLLTTQRFMELEDTADYKELLTNPHINQELNLDLVKDARFVKRDGNTPEKPLDYFDRKLADADHTEAVTCTLMSPSRIKTYQHQMQENNLDIDVVVQSKVTEYILSEHRDTIHSAVKNSNLTLWTTNEKILFPTVVLDNKEVFIGVYESRGTTRGTVSINGVMHNTSRAAVNWAKQKITEYRRKAKEIQAEDIAAEH